jgi:hypothetical protein
MPDTLPSSQNPNLLRQLKETNDRFRPVLVEALVHDFAKELQENHGKRLQVAMDGFPGFSKHTKAELFDEIRSASLEHAVGVQEALTRLGEHDDDVAEWVGLHYGHNFDAQSEIQKCDWRKRYWESHHPQDEKPRYLVCEGWSHIFAGTTESTTRWILDRETQQLERAEVLGRSGTAWRDLDKVAKADLLDSLINGNDILNHFADFDVVESESAAWGDHADDQQVLGERPSGA